MKINGNQWKGVGVDLTSREADVGRRLALEMLTDEW